MTKMIALESHQRTPKQLEAIFTHRKTPLRNYVYMLISILIAL